jgi:hypothetical protein
MPTRTINWPATVQAVQAVLNGPPQMTQAEIVSGVVVRTAIDGTPPGAAPGAGPAYDAASLDGVLNTSLYALSVQAWANLGGSGIQPAKAAWIELDRVCRAAFKVYPGAIPPIVAASFGLGGLPTWQPATLYGQGNGFVVPPVANGFNYLLAGSGTSGASPPVFPTMPGQTVADGGIGWTCVAPITAGQGAQPSPLPWDPTLQTLFTLVRRVDGGAGLASGNPGLLSLVENTYFAWQAALAAKPPADVTQDANSDAAIAALQTAIANAQAWVTASVVT